MSKLKERIEGARKAANNESTERDSSQETEQNVHDSPERDSSQEEKLERAENFLRFMDSAEKLIAALSQEYTDLKNREASEEELTAVQEQLNEVLESFQNTIISMKANQLAEQETNLRTEMMLLEESSRENLQNYENSERKLAHEEAKIAAKYGKEEVQISQISETTTLTTNLEVSQDALSKLSRIGDNFLSKECKTAIENSIRSCSQLRESLARTETPGRTPGDFVLTDDTDFKAPQNSPRTASDNQKTQQLFTGGNSPDPTTPR